MVAASAQGLHVVFGAGGAIGGAIVRTLASRGLDVRAVARSVIDLPPGVPLVHADLTDRQAAARAADGAAIVYHCAMPEYTRWPQEFPPLTRSIADAAAAAGASLVVADNLYAAPGHGRPISESDSPTIHGAKARTRAEMTASLLARDDLPVTFGRASDFYGAGQRGLHSIPGRLLFERAIAGARMGWPGSLDQPHALHVLDDVAAGLIVLATSPGSWGRAWNLPCPAPLTGRQYAAMIAAAAGLTPKVTAIPGVAIRLAGVVNAEAREVTELTWQYDRPFLVDDGAFRAEIGGVLPLPHDVRIPETVRWHRA